MMKDTNKIKRIKKSRAGLARATRKLQRAREERIWIENNPQIHILNYPYYKFKRWLSKTGKDGMTRFENFMGYLGMICFLIAIGMIIRCWLWGVC